MSLLLEVVRRSVTLALLAPVTLPLWPVYLPLRLVFGRPPVVPSAARFLDAARHALLGRPPAPGLSLPNRIVIVLCLLGRALTAPLWGLAWLMDEAIYGRALDRVAIVAPIFELSAARSGSTQLARYLEDDPRLAAPNALQVLLPFVWLWRLAPALSRLVPPERLRAAFLARLPADYLARHEMDPLRTDTFEIVTLRFQLGDLYNQLGPDAFADTFSPARVTPTNRAFWEGEFLPLLDRIGRKTLLVAPGRRLLVKGHFLAVAPQLAARHPDARFVTVLREPLARLRSTLSFHRSQPGEAWFGPIPWEWLARRDVAIEVDYCDAEQAFYNDAPNRLVVRFADYVNDLEGTLRDVYAHLELAPPERLRAAHEHRKRSYVVDRPLEDLGIDVAALTTRLAGYRAWCGGAERATA